MPAGRRSIQRETLPRGGVHHRYPPIRITFPTGKRDVELAAIGGERERARLAAERLLAMGPELVAAAHPWIIWIDARAGVRSAIDVARAKHDFGEALQAAAFARALRADDAFYRIAVRPGNDPALRIRFDRGGEEAERERRFCRGREDLIGEWRGQLGAARIAPQEAACVWQDERREHRENGGAEEQAGG